MSGALTPLLRFGLDIRGLTIKQPWASLICGPVAGAPQKLCENRVWGTSYRGLIAIHAGKAWHEGAGVPRVLIPDNEFMAIIGVARLWACVKLGEVPLSALAHYRPYVEGPWCWLLRDVLKLARPVVCRGYQRLWRLWGNEQALDLVGQWHVRFGAANAAAAAEDHQQPERGTGG